MHSMQPLLRRAAVAVIVCLAISTQPASAVRSMQAALAQGEAAFIQAQPVADVPEGYQFDGHVTFTPSISSPLRVHSGRNVSLAAPAPGVAGMGRSGGASHHTVLVKRDGRRYVKRLSHNGPLRTSHKRQLNEAVWPADADRHPSYLNFQTIVAGDLSCEGCDGSDPRTAIQDTTDFPYRSIGQLLGQLGTTSQALECTGTLIGRSHVLTAAHCVFDIHGTRQYVSSLNFSPGQSGAAQPYGVYQWSQVRILSQFKEQPDYTPTAINYDFALITLAQDVDPGIGAMGIQMGAGTATLNLVSAGYPADKMAGSMWLTACQGVAVNYGGAQGVFTHVAQCDGGGCSNILPHTCVASEGQSGAAMFDAASKVIRAIITGKLSTNEAKEYFVATKIDAFVYNTLAGWYAEDLPGAVMPASATGVPATAAVAAVSQPAQQPAANAAAQAQPLLPQLPSVLPQTTNQRIPRFGPIRLQEATPEGTADTGLVFNPLIGGGILRDFSQVVSQVQSRAASLMAGGRRR